MLVLIAHPVDHIAYALASCAPRAFTLVLLELVASAFFMQTTILINARMNQHANS